MRRRTATALLISVAALGAGCGSSSHAHAAPTCASQLTAIAPVTNRGERAATGDGITLDAASAAFTPTCVTNVPRGPFTLTVRNTGAVIHNVQIAAQHIDVDIKPRASATIRVNIATDPVVLVCRYHRTLGMVGVLIPAAAAG